MLESKREQQQKGTREKNAQSRNSHGFDKAEHVFPEYTETAESNLHKQQSQVNTGRCAVALGRRLIFCFIHIDNVLGFLLFFTFSYFTMLEAVGLTILIVVTV